MVSRDLMVRIATVVAIVALAGVLTEQYRDASREQGDVVLAAGAVEGLSFVGREAVPMGASIGFSNALEDNWAAIDLFLQCESSERLPEVTAHVAASWNAYRVADQLWRLYEEGQQQPLVRDIYAAETLVESLPALRSVLIGEGEGARIDNSSMKAVVALFEAAKAERAAAGDLVESSERRLGL